MALDIEFHEGNTIYFVLWAGMGTRRDLSSLS